MKDMNLKQKEEEEREAFLESSYNFKKFQKLANSSQRFFSVNQ